MELGFGFRSDAGGSEEVEEEAAAGAGAFLHCLGARVEVVIALRVGRYSLSSFLIFAVPGLIRGCVGTVIEGYCKSSLTALNCLKPAPVSCGMLSKVCVAGSGGIGGM